MPYNPYYNPSNLPVYANYTPAPYINTPTQQNALNQPTEALNNGGFIVVSSEEEVKRYPVAPGNFVTFRIENEPVIIEKSMSRSQFDTPHYERFKLVKEDMQENIPQEENKGVYEEIKGDITAIYEQIDRLKEGMANIRKQIKPIKHARLNKEEET